MTDQTHLHTVEASDLTHKPMRYFDFVMAAFVAILLLSNVLGAGKVAKVDLPLIGDWPFGAGILFFPLGYLIGDILTEVYGYARARRCVWVGFVALLFMAFMSWVVVTLPPPPTGPGNRPMTPSSGRCRASSSPASAPSGSGSSPTALSSPA
jgi:uncharacterized PurR-regulated membrane protein YhhQ (DUF165 family)